MSLGTEQLWTMSLTFSHLPTKDFLTSKICKCYYDPNVNPTYYLPILKFQRGQNIFQNSLLFSHPWGLGLGLG